MQSYNSAVDGKTFVRVGGGRGGGQRAQILPRSSNSTIHSVKSDLGVSSTTSLRRSNVTSRTASSPSHVTIASPGIHRVDTTHDVRQSNASVTVKSVAPVKKMTSVIDTKTGHVTSSVVSQETGRRSNPNSVLMTSSPTSVTPPSSLLTYGPESPSGDLNHNWMTSSSPRATSVLMTPTGMQVNSVISEGKANTLTDHGIPAFRNSSSVILRSIPDTLPAKMTSSGHVMTTTITQAEVHPQPETRRSQRLLSESSSIEQNDSAGLPTELPDKSEIGESSDQQQLLSDVIVETHPSVFVEGRDADFQDSSELALPVPDANEKTTSASAITSPISHPSTTLSGSSRVPDSAPEVVRTDSGSDGGGGLDLESETRQRSTFRFIGWNGNESTNGETVDPQCPRVLVYKDSEIALMLKASCLSERVGRDQRLYDLMVDIAINCTERLKKMKTIAQPAVHVQHLDTLPLTDSRSTREHLEELSRELNETVSINDVAYRFQSKDDVFIGTFIDGNVALKSGNCAIGASGVVVVLVRKNRFASVEAFADQLCRHIVSNRPLSLGRISAEELRKRSLSSPDSGKKARSPLEVDSFF